ncbi:MAG: hypothetical protein IJX26_01740 [Clostridia bacterium]|nr:hypothetical protein [Clostridia bacterium]
MKDFLIGAGLGFMIGAVMCKTCKPLSEMVQKGKKLVQEKIEEGKEAVQEKIEENSNQQSKKTKKA